MRRVDFALRFIAEGVREATYSNSHYGRGPAERNCPASNNSMESHAIKKKNEQERIAMSSR
jgi:small subunit ribosomal protein S7